MMDTDIKTILELLGHLWHRVNDSKELLFDRKLLLKALDYLSKDQNPFLYIREEMEQQIKERDDNYVLNHWIFRCKLEGDKKSVDKIKEELKAKYKNVNLSEEKKQKFFNYLIDEISFQIAHIETLEQQVLAFEILRDTHAENIKKLYELRMKKEITNEFAEREEKNQRECLTHSHVYIQKSEIVLKKAEKYLEKAEKVLQRLTIEAQSDVPYHLKCPKCKKTALNSKWKYAGDLHWTDSFGAITCPNCGARIPQDQALVVKEIK